MATMGRTQKVHYEPYYEDLKYSQTMCAQNFFIIAINSKEE